MGSTLEKREQVIDQMTGEVLYDKKNVISFNKMPEEPAYIKLYVDDLSRLNKLTAGETKILLYVAARADYEGIASLPLGIKNRIATSAGCSASAVSSAISKFCNEKILKRLDVGVYELNPDYFARGKWKEIRERRKAFYTTITYTPDGQRVVKTDLIEPSSLDVTQ
jgi:hypothetical protein